jgi:hypothetical protein
VHCGALPRSRQRTRSPAPGGRRSRPPRACQRRVGCALVSPAGCRGRSRTRGLGFGAVGEEPRRLGALSGRGERGGGRHRGQAQVLAAAW